MASTGTILIVDDSHNDVDLLLRTLDQLEVANPTHVCYGAEDALRFLQTHELPAVMLLDIKMPDKDGFYVLNSIKKNDQWKDLVVIVLTTSSDLGDIKLSYELGANSFLTKPLDLTEFKEMIRAFHGYWVLRNQPAPERGKLIEKPQSERN